MTLTEETKQKRKHMKRGYYTEEMTWINDCYKKVLLTLEPGKTYKLFYCFKLGRKNLQQITITVML